jgi:hypothetical protein
LTPRDGFDLLPYLGREDAVSWPDLCRLIGQLLAAGCCFVIRSWGVTQQSASSDKFVGR